MFHKFRNGSSLVMSWLTFVNFVTGQPKSFSSLLISSASSIATSSFWLMLDASVEIWFLRSMSFSDPSSS